MSGRNLDLRRRLEALAFGQAGYFTAAQALRVGYSYQAQKYHVDSGNWIRVDRGLFRLPHWPAEPTDEFVLWTLWSHGQGVLSHDTALAIHNLGDVDPAKINLTIPKDSRARHPLVVLHVADIPEEDIEHRRSWSVTSPLRTLADVSAGDLSQEHIDTAMNDAMHRGLVTPRSVRTRSAGLGDRAALRLERALTAALEDYGHL